MTHSDKLFRATDMRAAKKGAQECIFNFLLNFQLFVLSSTHVWPRCLSVTLFRRKVLISAKRGDLRGNFNKDAKKAAVKEVLFPDRNALLDVIYWLEAAADLIWCTASLARRGKIRDNKCCCQVPHFVFWIIIELKVCLRNRRTFFIHETKRKSLSFIQDTSVRLLSPFPSVTCRWGW